MQQKTPVTNLKYDMKARLRHISLFNCLSPNMQLFTIGDFKALSLNSPTHSLLSGSKHTSQGRETARRRCQCSSSSRSEVLCTQWPFDNAICMLTMLDPAPEFAFHR